MQIYLIKKQKNRIYKSEAMVLAVSGKKLTHDEKGAPLVDEGFVSISDTKNYWACAFSDRPVGIDIEELSRSVSPSVVKRLHEAERKYLEPLSEGSSEWKEELLTIWTRKESYAKFTGKGLAEGFRSFCVLDEWQDTLETKLFSGRYKGLIYSSTEEAEIRETAYDAPMNKSALEAGADILDMFGCSASTLKKKLLGRGYTEEEAGEAVDKLLERGFLNDSEYARSLAQKYTARGYSSRRIELELKRKGVSPEDAREEAVKHREGDRQRAEAAAEKLLKGADPDQKLKTKIAGKLSSLGYETSIVYDIIQKLN
ncbi:MAG: RecX family transcriptional regulator [Firmicutes bacterium]|nr:RecX family transcriptional regulator [Bacillota bacterium]